MYGWHWFSFVFLLNKFFLISSQSLPLLLLISFDGFRFDYPNLYGPLGNFSRLKQRGVHIHSMTPTFNTASLPNHFTLLTGLYEEIHGVISDQIYDPQTNSIFQLGDNLTSQLWLLPKKTIWTINEQRLNARTGVIGWIEDSINISKYEKYDKNRSYQDIIDQILNWFNDPNQPINFGTIFFPEPALIGRQTGPYSTRMKEIIHQCDEYLGYLLNKIDKDVKLKNNLHLIVTSNHGFEQINGTNKLMYLEDYIDMTKIKAFGTETVLNIFINSSYDINDIIKDLTKIPHTKIYKKENIPEQYHYKKHSRIGDIIILLEQGYELYRHSSFDNKIDIDLNSIHGNSGYDNQLDSMKTIFYANGPQLKENFSLSNKSILNNVDIFGLMCLLLGIDKCPQSNGSLANIQQFLMDPYRVFNIHEKDIEKLQDGPMGLVIYLLVLVSFVLILIMAVVWSGVSFRNASAMARAAYPDAATIAEQNQYKFTQINDLKLNPAIGDDNL